MKSAEWMGAKSICRCKHTGDGEYSDHAPELEVEPDPKKRAIVVGKYVEAGHGKCTMPGCKCRKFVWVKFDPGYQQLLDDEKKEGKRK
jgi:hypothetical protein